jgi:hypothetical protein
MQSICYVKVKFSLCLTKHHAMMAYWGSGGIALYGGEWSASRPGRFTPRERAPGTQWIRDWVGPRTVLDAVVKRKIPSPHRESKPRTPVVQPVAQRYTDWAIIFVGSWRWCISIKRIVFLDFIHRLVSQEQTKLKNIIDKR